MVRTTEQGLHRHVEATRNEFTKRPRLRRPLFIRCAAVATVILLANSFGAAQGTVAGPPQRHWAEDLKKNPALMAEFGQLLKKLQQNVQFPPERNHSRLLPLLPESTVFYAAFPNYGDAVHQALAIFRQEMKESPELRAWWQQGEMAANGPKVEDAVEKIYQLSQYLGDEIAVSGAMNGSRNPDVLILAEARKPGLKDFLLQMEKEFGSKSPTALRVLDPQELAAAQDVPGAQGLVILVRPDFVVGSSDIATLRRFNASLDGNDQDFAATPFGQRLAQAYGGGTVGVGGADVQRILKQVLPGIEPSRKLFERSGFADMKYAIWQHKNVEGHAASQVELSFTGPRHGVASWLAAPAPLGSLDFVSPKAFMAVSVLLKNPAEIFDDIEELAMDSNPQALASIAQVEQGLKISLRNDLFGQLGGEVTLEADSIEQPGPTWKAILKVKDVERLQATLTTLLAMGKISPQQSEEDGVVYYTLRIPSGQKTNEITYAFVDGYVIVASSRGPVTEAIGLHRGGDSLAQSPKFLAALPATTSAGPSSRGPSSPGAGPALSGLVYEDPVAMTLLNMRRVWPEMAESIFQTAVETSPMVMAAYGEESAIREFSRSSGFDAGAVLVVAAVAIPNLLRARMAANESSAVATIRMANVAQVTYSTMNSQRGFARDLATLGPDPRGPGHSSPDHASVIDATLGNASCTASAWCTKTGYQFRMTAVCKSTKCDEYVVVGTPVGSNTGTRSFCSTSDGVVRFKMGPAMISPIGVSECKAWLPLR